MITDAQEANLLASFSDILRRVEDVQGAQRAFHDLQAAAVERIAARVAVTEGLAAEVGSLRQNVMQLAGAMKNLMEGFLKQQEALTAVVTAVAVQGKAIERGTLALRPTASKAVQ